MEAQEYLKIMKEFQELFLNYIEGEINNDEFQSLTYFTNLHNLTSKRGILEDIMYLILNVAENHHKEPNFFEKIINFCKFYQSDIKSNFKSIDIFNIFKISKKLLLLFLQNQTITLDDEVIKSIISDNNFIANLQLRYYLYSEIKNYIDEDMKKNIESYISEVFPDGIELFIQKCQEGENDSYICSLIRSDSVEEFISYVTKTNFPINKGKIRSLFETNSFLKNNQFEKLIEYAAFFGSIQIYRYLRMNNVDIPNSVWNYAIHGRNADIIHLLEEDKIEPFYKDYQYCLNEAIRCHHNDIANYIIDNLMNNENKCCYEQISKSFNFAFFPCFLDNFYNDENIGFEFNKVNYFSTIASVNIPDDATRICKGTFKDFKSLKEIIIPSSVIIIGDFAFEGCSSLEKIEIPSSVTEIGNGVFMNCSSLKEIVIPSSITKIGSNVFEGCSSLEKIEIPSSVTEIEEKTFKNCISLKEIIIPSSITKIGSNVFEGCSSLIKIEIPSSVTEIGNNIFENCTSLKEIAFLSSLTEIGQCAFDKCSSLERVTFQNSLEVIREYQFRGCSSLKEITIPTSLKKIGCFSFFGCSSLEKFEIPPNVTEIECNSFYNCTSLTHLEIPPSVTSIKSNAFEGCKSLCEVSLNCSLKIIENYVFYGCGLRKIKIPSSVTKIGNSSFANCTSLVEINIPSSVREIGNFSFYGCSSLEEIEIPSSVRIIGKYAFANCFMLKEILIPSSVKLIGNFAFYKCNLIEISEDVD